MVRRRWWPRDWPAAGAVTAITRYMADGQYRKIGAGAASGQPNAGTGIDIAFSPGDSPITRLEQGA